MRLHQAAARGAARRELATAQGSLWLWGNPWWRATQRRCRMRLRRGRHGRRADDAPPAGERGGRGAVGRPRPDSAARRIAPLAHNVVEAEVELVKGESLLVEHLP